LILVESLNLGSWLLVRNNSRQPENTICVVIGKSFQVGSWIICEGTINPSLGSGVYWNEYLIEIDRYKKHRERTNRSKDESKEQEDETDLY